VELFTLGYRKSLDGLRGIAILAVVLSHVRTFPFGGGFFGVDLFFVLSGFLITSLLLEEWRETSDVSLKAFYARRALRLLPALILFLGTMTAVSAWREPPDQSAKMGTSALMALFYCANWFVASRSFPRSELSATWSLSVEEQFYILWPMLLLLMLKGKWSMRAISAVIVAGIAASAAVRAWLWNTGSSWERVYYGSDTHADGLLAGALVAVMMASGVVPASPRGARILNWVAHGMMVFLGVFFVRGWAADPMLFQGGYLALNLGAAAVVYCLVCSPWAPIRKVCEFGPLVWLGKISYGVYLWHLAPPLLITLLPAPPGGVRPLAGFALTLGLAAVSYYGFERPLLRFKRRFERVARASRV
jgi:peptidoglycan/LPS O-acetylase OafA/YrhL